MTTRTTTAKTTSTKPTRKRSTTTSKTPVTTAAKKSTTASTAEPIKELAANPFAFEVLELASSQKTNAKKVEVLKKYYHDSLKTLFVWNFDNVIQSSLPPGDVPYAATSEQTSFSGTLSEKIEDSVSKMNEMKSNSLGSADQGHTSIRKEYQNFYNFVRGGNDTLSSIKRESMFINLLQGLHPLEAEILILVKDKKLQTKYKLSKEVISQAYPNIVWRDQ